MNSLFITGTDTGIGKTHVAVSLIKQFNREGYSTFGIKPIASGCERNKSGKLVNADALALQKAASIKQPYDIVNPIALEDPIAPHLAAYKSGFLLTKKTAINKLSNSIQPQADINIIEGVGGWSVPLNRHELVSDIICTLNLPVILVVGIKLGCLNHTILTSENILQTRVPFIGWIANCIEPDLPAAQENIDTLKNWISAPYLGTVPYNTQPRANGIDIEIIMQHNLFCI